MELTPSQEKAVTHKEGPLLVIAGAGTGKTLITTRRIEYLISSGIAKPEEILALTFSEKAASEMEERLDLLLPIGIFGYTISTFHAFGDSVLREKGLAIGINPNFRVLTRPEQLIFFREHLFEFGLNYYRPLGDPTRFIEAIITLISRAKDEDAAPEEYMQYARALMNKEPNIKESNVKESQELEACLSADKEFAEEQMELASAYTRYQKLMIEKGLVDFGDQVNLTLKLFREHPRILRLYQDRYRFILVDEFQDTNYAQFQLVRLLAGRRRNIMVVGDDDQSIYKFRGAAISNILKFKEYYPDAAQVVLTENFRSTQVILDPAYRLIQNNNPDRLEVKNSIDKRLKSININKIDNPILYLPYGTVSDEADGIASLIGERISGGNYKYSDFAILVRTNKDAEPYIKELERRGILFIFSGRSGLYKQKEIRLLLSFIRIISDPYDNLSLHHLASSEIYNISMYDITICASMAKKLNRPLYTIFRGVSESVSASDPHLHLHLHSIEDKEKIRHLISEIDSCIEYSRSASTKELLYKYIVDSGYLKRLIDEQTGQNASSSDLKIRNIARFFERIDDFSRLTRYDRVGEFVRYIDMLLEVGDEEAEAEPSPEEDLVKVLTVHKSKGLEFRVVIMAGVVNDRFPRRDTPEKIELPQKLIKEYMPIDNYHLQEERRLFYVGMTRAEEELYITSARDYGGKRKKRSSRFVSEALGIEDKKLGSLGVKGLQSLGVMKLTPQLPNSKLPNSPTPIPEDQVITLSYNQINNYLTCPLKYKYAHILNVSGLFRRHSQVYGEAIHKTIGEYLRAKTDERDIKLEDLIKQFETYCTGEGFINKRHEEERLEEGRRILANFYNKEEESMVIPAYIEKEFSFFIQMNRIKGRWDRVDEKNGSVKIIDYKSSQIDTKEKADKETKESLQLAIYSLAYHRIYKRMPDTVELHFLGSGTIGSCKVEQLDLERRIEEIKKVADWIRMRRFPATEGDNSCRYCEYAKICPKLGS